MKKWVLAILLTGALAWAQNSPYEQAMKHYLAGQHAEALVLFEQARQVQDLPEYSLWIGWCQLRLQQLEASQSAFERVLAVLPDHPEALTGMGYVALRQNRLNEAESAFGRALLGQQENKDALVGMAVLNFRRDQPHQSKEWAQKVLRLDPQNETILDLLQKLADVESPEDPYPARTPRLRPATTQIPFRAGRDYFEQGPDWKAFFVQGMNLGPALPGRFPSQFPQSRALYLEWLQQMAAMGCNAVRVYTVLPPGFYQAFWEYHQNPKNPPLWLIHGVWAEEPPASNYRDAAYDAEFVQEIHDVIDLLHGQADLGRRPGHAWGSYTADVSPWVMAILLGREWEPYTVEGFNRLHPGLTYQGTYVSGTPKCSPMEAWMARLCDLTVAYEMDGYNCQRPISFTNWPTLDPLSHSSEASKAEISGLLAARGESNPVRSREYDNDVEGISTAHLKASPAFFAGLYASYHAYPYYPDFMINQPEYARGGSHYAAYLKELKQFYGQRPLLIAEYGVPSSRGNCHLQPEGMHHGGHSELEQGQIDARLTREIWEEGCAGGALFAWIDEWFKKNWLVIDREIPLERNRLWLNYLDAEQNYGMLAMRPGTGRPKTLSGQSDEWTGPPLARSPGFPPPGRGTEGGGAPPGPGDLYVESDEGFLYLRWDLKRALGPEDELLIGVNTIDAQVGEHCLPTPAGPVRCATGMEFLLNFRGQQGQLKVARDYQPYLEIAASPSLGTALVPNPQMLPRDRWDGDFRPLMVESNRARLGRDGRLFPALRQDWGRLLQGSLQQTSLADWNYSSTGQRLEVRLPWGLLGVTDPSQRRVIYEPWEAVTIDTRVSEGFSFVLARLDQGVLQGEPAPSPLYSWPTWEKPAYRSQVKPAYEEMRRIFSQIAGRPR